MKRCTRCALPPQFPGIQLGPEGECNYCATHDLIKERKARDTQRLRSEFDTLIAETVARGGNRYDALVAYSGGKDSTSMLLNLRRRYPTMKLLAHTLDNGFISETAWKNIEQVTRTLGVDLEVTKPRQEFTLSLFRHMLTQEMPFAKELRASASTLCQSCIGMVVGTSLNLCIASKIPLAFCGLTPGQIPSTSLENYWKVQSCFYISDRVYRDDPINILKLIADPIRERFGAEADAYFFKNQYVEPGSFIPKVIFPFHALWEYDERRIYAEIAELGWRRPTDVDSCSTNCMINSAGIVQFKRRYGYHPYNGELSNLVRQGKLTYDEALALLEARENAAALRQSSAALGLPIVDG